MNLEELKEYFNSIELPKEFYLNPAERIADPKLFVETQLKQIEAHGVKSPAYDRLMNFKNKLDEAQ